MLHEIFEHLFFGVGFIIVKALRIKRYKDFEWRLLGLNQKQNELTLIGVVFWIIVVITAAIII